MCILRHGADTAKGKMRSRCSATIGWRGFDIVSAVNVIIVIGNIWIVYFDLRPSISNTIGRLTNRAYYGMYGRIFREQQTTTNGVLLLN